MIVAPWSSAAPDDARMMRAAVKALIEKHRSPDDASADRIVDGWIAAGELGVLPSGGPALTLRVPTATASQRGDLDLHRAIDRRVWLASEIKTYDAESGIRLWFAPDGPRVEIERRSLQLQEADAADLARQKEDERIEKAKAIRLGELHHRHNRWAETAPMMRALMRGHSDPKIGAVFHALAEAIRGEPDIKPDEQPPRSVWRYFDFNVTPDDK